MAAPAGTMTQMTWLPGWAKTVLTFLAGGTGAAVILLAAFRFMAKDTWEQATKRLWRWFDRRPDVRTQSTLAYRRIVEFDRCLAALGGIDAGGYLDFDQKAAWNDMGGEWRWLDENGPLLADSWSREHIAELCERSKSLARVRDNHADLVERAKALRERLANKAR